MRSSNLWEDAEHTTQVTEFEPLDLLLFNDTANPYGAHIAVYLGDSEAIHLSKQVGKPAVRSLTNFRSFPEYRVLIGAKRVARVTRANEHNNTEPTGIGDA